MIFVTGGARSGKSKLAVALAADAGGPVTMVVTAVAGDAEMAARIAEHRRHRPLSWGVVEEPLDVAGAVAGVTDGGVIILDCLTLWVANLMADHSDAEIGDIVKKTVHVVGSREGVTIVVSNEVGSGLVPMHPVGRRFRDLQGRVNQTFSAAAETAYLVVAGRALPLPAWPR
ncbi:MAG: bifunctional adenosylcobinamide kinase/adenosylcobinamide-phosphate guanylyltransferase [Actinobacteria bacterium]|nr:bifunctional adenosylcobinamide kinase/adenosylcobinamide-phosphate guanylyltransferase [Actinomycetota bacterium]